MADIHNLFQEFNSTIRLTEERRHALLTARNDLRKRVKTGFEMMQQSLPTVHNLEFQTQGSFIMDTIINPISEDYDLDDGIYFLGNRSRQERPPTNDFHDFVVHCITNNNPYVNKVKDKDTCVRVYYKEGYAYLFENKMGSLPSGFHIDMPIYYAGSKKSPDLAHLKKSWITSDPIEFIKWFEDKVQSNFKSEFLYERKIYSAEYDAWRDSIRKDDAQLRRIVRYLKAWCDYKGGDMPCGIILTILAADNYTGNQRDDIALRDTLINIQTALKKEFVCRRPTTPVGENLLTGYEHEAHFMAQLSSFVEAAKQGINEGNQKRACGKWQSQFGNRFSCASAMDFDENAASYKAPAVIAGNAKSA